MLFLLKKLGYGASKVHVVESRPKAHNPDNLSIGAHVNPLLSLFIISMWIFGVFRRVCGSAAPGAQARVSCLFAQFLT